MRSRSRLRVCSWLGTVSATLTLMRFKDWILLNALKERVATNGDPKSTWVVSFTAADPEPRMTGELTIAESAVGMNLNNRPFLQSTIDPQVAGRIASVTGFADRHESTAAIAQWRCRCVHRTTGCRSHVSASAPNRGGCAADSRGCSHLPLVL